MRHGREIDQGYDVSAVFEEDPSKRLPFRVSTAQARGLALKPRQNNNARRVWDVRTSGAHAVVNIRESLDSILNCV